MSTENNNTAANDLCIAAVASAAETAPAVQHERASSKKPSSKSARPSRNSKKDELITLLAKPKGARVSVLAERLAWQPHTVRAALSGLRKQGIEITRTKAPKTGETLYAIVEPKAEAVPPVDETAS